MRKPLIIKCPSMVIALMILLLFVGCKGQCQAPALETDASALVDHVPKGVSGLLLASALEELVMSLEATYRSLPFDDDELRVNGLGLEELLARGGFATDKPALSYLLGNHLIVVASVAEPRAFDEVLSGQESTIVHDYRLVETPKGALAHNRGRVLIALPLSSGAGGASKILSKIVELDEGARWDGIQAHLDFVGALDEPPRVHGVFEPGHWLKGIDAKGHAANLLNRLIRQMGRVHFGAYFDEEVQRLKIELHTPGQAGEPVVLTSLGSAHGSLPRVGGLARPGALGVVRLSADPDAVFTLVRSTLPSIQRLELENFLDDLAEELKIDVRESVLENIDGHFLVVVYGFEDRVLREDNQRLLADLFQLKATREALLIPIKDRAVLEPILDIATQLSRGNLRRQVIRHTIQYAWIPDGSLEWALILHDDYVLFVDSAVAFDHATAWERSPGALADSLREVGLGRILEEDHSGFYVDLRTLSNLLAESGQERAAAWMRPFKTVVFSTDEMHAQVEFILHRD